MPVKRDDDVRKEISSGKPAPVYLLVGDDDGALTALVKEFSTLVEEDLRAFNHDRFYATDKGVTPDAVVEAARTLPMMAPRRLVSILRAEKWLKPKRRGAEVEGNGEEESGGELDALERYIASPEPQTTLVLVAADVDKGRRLTKALYKQAVVVEAWGFKSDREFRSGELGAVIQQAQAWIQRKAKAAGRTIDPDAARLLAERAGSDIGQLRADVERLLVFAGERTRLTREDAEAIASGKTSQDRWAVANAIERGDTPTALRELALALDAGVVPYLMLGQLAWVARDRLARGNPAGVRTAVNAVFRTDLDIKSSGGDPRVLLERLVVELCDAVPTRRRF
ncbi:MAG: DNA polymerase III subunit delta [Vicinamibacterales bacterium]